VSPFGWGELCYRDFEAACLGTLLIKPSVAHLRTEPDVFVENETYVPVRWDLSDLEEKCRYYLEHGDEAKRIIANARQAYAAYFPGDRLMGTVRAILDGLLDS
jgi:spore maturation protein CgeB